MRYMSKRGLVALIVLITVLGTVLPFVWDTNDNENSATASANDLYQVTGSYSSSGQNIFDSRNLFEIASQSGVASDYIYLPNLYAPGLHSSSVTPLYTVSPAPMGITDYGYMEPSGLKIPYQYNTSSFLGTVMFEDLNAQYLMNSNPETVAVQLSAVLSIPDSHGTGTAYFWIKNILLYTPSTGSAQLIDNIWDISSPSFVLPEGIISAGNGNVIPGLMYYYAGPVINLSGEATVALYINSGTVNWQNSVAFQYSTGGGEHGEAAPGINYDMVTFSSQTLNLNASGGKFIVDGFSKTPSGMLKDVELAVTGPGMGSTTSIYSANGQLTLKFQGPDGTYTKLPAAYNYGSNTGETVQGLSVWWSSQMKPMAHLSTGPSLPVSLWGSQVSHSGAVNLQGKIDPANSFVFINMGTHVNNGTAAWAPVNPNGTYKFSLPGRISYTMQILLSNFNPQYVTIATTVNESSEEGTGQSHGGGGGGEGADQTLAWNNFTLSENLSKGVYTPLYANGNGQLKDLTIGSSQDGSVAGTGSLGDPYIVENNQYTRISELFTRANNFLYPQFSGILVENTDAYLKIDNPASFQYRYPVPLFNVLYSFDLPYYNNLNMIMSNTSGVTVCNATSITGWFPYTMNSGIASNLMILNSKDFLVASNTFSSMGSSLSIYNSNGMAGNGTIWGNTFSADAVLYSSYANAMLYQQKPLAISVYSSGNIIYNNYFGVQLNQVSPLHDPYTYMISIYSNSWNLPGRMAENYTNTVNGYTLTGSIVGCGYQGGNYWEGLEGTIPYNDGGKVAVGGDYEPLSPPVYNAVFNVSGNHPADGWSIMIYSKSHMPLPSVSGAYHLINGTYEYRVLKPSNYSVTPSTGTFTVNGSDAIISISFSKVIYPVTFMRTGISDGTPWTLTIGNAQETTTNSSVTMYLENGTYSYSATTYSTGVSATESGHVLVMGNSVQEKVMLQNRLHKVSFALQQDNFQGLWSLNIEGQAYSSTSGSIISYMQNGLYNYSVTGPAGYEVTPAAGTLEVFDGNITVSLSISVKTYNVTFVGNGLKSGTQWQVQLGNQTFNSSDSEITFSVPEGNYTYSISPVNDYTNNLSSGQIVISDGNLTVPVSFKQNTDYAGSALMVLVGTIAFAAISAMATYLVGRKR
jgi:thermopsin